jgi:thymidylate synthase ThyX
MNKAKAAKKEKIISNSEYKRFREFARFVLPEGRYTELYITFYENDFKGFLKLRNSSHAQTEHIWIAQKMKKTLENYKKNNILK